MTELSFSKLGYRKLFAPVLAPNRTSVRVLEKNGYRREGILAAEVMKNGEYHDLHYHARHR
jgi:[ribosomal protein S5]-alanine N-acetyltransferase